MRHRAAERFVIDGLAGRTFDEITKERISTALAASVTDEEKTNA